MKNKIKQALIVFIALIFPNFAFACRGSFDVLIMKGVFTLFFVFLIIYLIVCALRKKFLFNWFFFLTVFVLLCGLSLYAMEQYQDAETRKRIEECKERFKDDDSRKYYCNPLC